jgi:hypothetical protein
MFQVGPRCNNPTMTSEFDGLFDDHTRQAQPAGDPDAERKLAWEQWLDQLTVALQPVADAAIAHGHQAAVTRQNRTVEFEIRFADHPDAPASCSFSPIFPSGAETAVYIDSNGPGKFDDPRDPMRRPLTRFSMDDARNYVTSMIRSASKLLP